MSGRTVFVLLVMTGLVVVTTQQETHQAVEKNLKTPRPGLENHLMTSREILENNQTTTSKTPKNHNMMPQMQQVKEPQEALQQARPYQIENYLWPGSLQQQQVKKVEMHQNAVVKQVPHQMSKLQNYKVEALRPQQVDIEQAQQQLTLPSLQEHPSSQLQTGNLTLQDFKLGLDDAADPRLFWHLGHHQPNCPNHPHPPFPPVPPRCGGVFHGQSVLLSPGFPGPYPPSAQCTFTVLPSGHGVSHTCFRVTFAYLALRWSPNCQQDWIQIDQGPRLCGGLTGDKYYQTRGNLNVEFTSGAIPGPEGSGFRLIVSQVPCHVIDPPAPPPRPPPPIIPPHRPPYHPPPPQHPHPPPHHPPPHHPPPHHPPPHHPPPHHPPHRPPIQPPHHCPPEHPVPPIYHPPPVRPPIYYPPYKPEPPIYYPPHRPEPPIYHPPSRPPNHQHPTWWWRWNRILKCEWSGIKHLPPGLCPPPHEPTHKPPHKPPHGPPQGPPSGPHYPPPPTGENCGRVVSSPQFLVRSDDWLPRRSPSGPNRPWSCQLSIFKAAPSACEVHLTLENLQLRCGVEFLEVAGERVCGNQPLRQLSADFRGPESRIIYHNLSGDAPPGNFVIRGYQNYDCSPLILDVTPAKKIAQPSFTTPKSLIVYPVKINEIIK